MFKLQRLVQRIDFVSAKHISLLNKRTKFTLAKMDASETCPIQRPTPILLLNTIATKDVHDKQDIFDWSNKLQSQFSKEGYFSVSINMTLPDKEDKEPLKTCYQELKQATSELSFFPPLMISSGEIAWRISQKYVSNRPVSGLIMVEEHQKQQPPPINQEILDKFYPTSEFEPHFPLLMISSSSSSVPHFLNGWIDHINLESTSSHHLFKTIIQWMDDIGM
ncbi:MAG: hypothetical protein EXX96DRAFT_557985 [Benjaminiella poitrasii]|nr:MAG: hypothetical protein EXX96DRAFT_557985 [Benjaminiella poitrasii]